MKPNIFASQSTCMGVSVSLSCLFVHEPPYQIYTNVLQSCFFPGSSRMDHRIVFHVRVGLTQAHPNNVNLLSTNPQILIRIGITIHDGFVKRGLIQVSDLQL